MILTFDSIRASARTNAKCSYIYADCFAVISKFQNYGTLKCKSKNRTIGALV